MPASMIITEFRNGTISSAIDSQFKSVIQSTEESSFLQEPMTCQLRGFTSIDSSAVLLSQLVDRFSDK